jgi:hypothetical protein
MIDQKPNDKERNPFGELLLLLSEEELIRFKKRAQLADNPWLAQVFEDEIIERTLPILYG